MSLSAFSPWVGLLLVAAPPPLSASKGGKNGTSGTTVMQMGAQVLAAADDLESQARACITQGNSLRKTVNALRSQQRRISDNAASAGMRTSADALAAQMAQWQQQGGTLRERSQQLYLTAASLFIEGFVAQWQPWVNNPSPLVMKAMQQRVVAHNNVIRSVHPALLKMMPAAKDLPKKHQGMSIKVPALAGQEVPDQINASSFQVGRQRAFFAHIEVEPTRPGEAALVPLNRIHKWRLLVSDLRGAPIKGAKIDIVGHMPGHVHGLPTQPRVTGEVAPGVYRVDGMKFQMNGWWVMQFNIEHQGHEDSVRFNLLL